MTTYGTIIIGGGAAGLSAALTLGRCRRQVLLIDTGDQRNKQSHEAHGFLTRDGIPPQEFQSLARADLQQYTNVTIKNTMANTMVFNEDTSLFNVRTYDAEEFSARTVILATGLKDIIPNIKNVEQFYGKSVHHCPYCDGWEHADQSIVVYGKTTGAMELGIKMKTWSQTITVCTDGPHELTIEELERLERNNIPIIETAITELVGDSNGNLNQILFTDGTKLDCSALFFSTGHEQASSLAASMKCELNDNGAITITDKKMTSIPGLYAVGDCSSDAHLLIVAAAEGATAAININETLTALDTM